MDEPVARELPAAPAQEPPRRRLHPAVTYALLGVWIGLALLGISSLAVPHMASMPAADKEERLTRALLEMRRRPWQRYVVHVIYERCSCTERLFRHLLARGAFPDAEEVVLFVGSDDARRPAVVEAGFAYRGISPAELGARFGLEAAPLLFNFDTAGTLRYAGGYFDHPSTIKSLDVSIYARVTAGETPAALPVFGCAVSPRLQEAVDPLGIVYRN